MFCAIWRVASRNCPGLLMKRDCPPVLDASACKRAAAVDLTHVDADTENPHAGSVDLGRGLQWRGVAVDVVSVGNHQQNAIGIFRDARQMSGGEGDGVVEHRALLRLDALHRLFQRVRDRW